MGLNPKTQKENDYYLYFIFKREVEMGRKCDSGTHNSRLTTHKFTMTLLGSETCWTHMLGCESPRLKL